MRKARLLNEYLLCTQEVLKSVSELQGCMGTVPKAEYQRLHCITAINRMKCEQARLDLERHVEATVADM